MIEKQVRNMAIQLDLIFEEVFKKDSSRSISLWVSVRRSLQQFHLTDSYSEACIFSIAYERAQILIERGEKIDKFFPWIRGTTYNIVRELSKAQCKSVCFDESIQLEANSVLCTDEMLDEDVLAIRKAFKCLSIEDQELLSLSIIEGLKSKNIRQKLSQTGAEDCSEAGIRKRKERALKRLRQYFHSFRPREVKV
jgi:DNA-directed RNA polymerase specialized sigma24 family protein